MTTTLAHAISDVTGVDVTDTGFTLNDHVDPEALDRLFKPKADGTQRIDGHLSFTIWGYQVTVYSDGQIAIVPPRQHAQSSGGPGRGHRTQR
ncbi:MAG: HalOD1 output domain-containing protein [Halosimplex sp.]